MVISGIDYPDTHSQIQEEEVKKYAAMYKHLRFLLVHVHCHQFYAFCLRVGEVRKFRRNRDFYFATIKISQKLKIEQIYESMIRLKNR
jgi:hypothetical protein